LIAGVATVAAALAAAPAASAAFTGHGHPASSLRVNGLHVAPGVQLPRTHLPYLLPRGTVRSTNWSGYAAAADSGQRIRYVAANFNVPSVNCANSPVGASGFAYAEQWAGLDGFGNSTVEQIGVGASCDSAGTPRYFAWYEMYPRAPVAFSGISPGDAVSVSVFFNGSSYELDLTDLTSGGFVKTTQPCPSGSTCRDKSAEVITEDPGGAVAGGYDLADFGMANDTSAVVTSQSGKHGTLAALTSYWTSSEITMVDNSGTQMAVPSGLQGGQAFDVAWRSAT
jgi:hypothetical protein